jgi:hypothetical protein
MNWRYSLKDGIYRPSGAFNLPGGSSKNRYIGTVYLGQITYDFNRFLPRISGYNILIQENLSLILVETAMRY